MKRPLIVLALLALTSTALVARQAGPVNTPPAQPQGRGGAGAPAIDVPWNPAIPPGTADHAARKLKESSRHGQWVDIKMQDGAALHSWIVYPERADKTGVVLVIHD